MQGFWKELRKPIFVLAPMADVTDAAFRRIIAKYGKPDVLWTEFVSADGLALAPEEPARTADGHRSGGGRKKLLKDLEYTEAERPIVAQFFTSRPEYMRNAAELACKLGFDGVDINMGCPDKSVEKQGAGAALMKDSQNALAVIEAAILGVAGELPVSVKTRLGFNKIDLHWIETLLSARLPVLTVHLRTRKEMSKVPAHWELAKDIVNLRDKISPETLIIFNGDVMSLEEGQRRVEETGCDGVMFGRAIFGNPWLFAPRGEGSTLGIQERSNLEERGPSLEEKLRVLIEHTKLFEELLGDTKSFHIMKKHFKAYISGFDGASELRVKLMETANAREVEEILDNFLTSRQGLTLSG